MLHWQLLGGPRGAWDSGPHHVPMREKQLLVVGGQDSGFILLGCLTCVSLFVPGLQPHLSSAEAGAGRTASDVPSSQTPAALISDWWNGGAFVVVFLGRFLCFLNYLFG